MATTCYSKKEPYAHKTPLGWALVGKTCINTNDNIHGKCNKILKTSVVSSSDFNVKFAFPSKLPFDDNPFETRKDDDLSGLSCEDRQFIDIMKIETCVNSKGNIELPLPIKSAKTLPDNRQAVFQRTKSTLMKLKKDTDKLSACLQSFNKSLIAGHVELVPLSEQVPTGEACWLPTFAVQHPKKKKIRLVFDASARFSGVSLNDLLLQGPDLNNSLRGVLMRFRERSVGFMTDIESMFNSFALPVAQRDLYRFYWFNQNQPEEPIVQYRSTCYIFGSKPSPAIATYGLRFAALLKQDISPGVLNFINRSFYVDDGVSSADTPSKAIDIIGGARETLSPYHIRLHKIMSNSEEVLQAFPSSELVSGIQSLSFDEDLVQNTLGTAWDTKADEFLMQINTPDKPFTRRGILSVVNSVYDPIGIASPVILAGRLIQRTIINSETLSDNNCKSYWDDPLPDDIRPVWDSWKMSLSSLSQLRLSRCFRPPNFGPFYQELHIFCDASDKAIGCVAYMRSVNDDGNVHVCFILGDSKVAPRAANTMPRLELCAAMEAAKYSSKISSELDIKPRDVFLYSDSKVVLGYIGNQEKRFAKYVSRRTQVILDHTNVEQWSYVCSVNNPADIATRAHDPHSLISSCWLKGPSFLQAKDYVLSPQENIVDLPEQLHEKKILKTSTCFVSESIFNSLCSRNANWLKILNAAKIVLKFKCVIDNIRQHHGISLACRSGEVSDTDAMIAVIRDVQSCVYNREYSSLLSGVQIAEHNKLADLNPFLDKFQIMRVGGRLSYSNLAFDSKHPILLPFNHPLTIAIFNFHHQKCGHQGRHITHGTIRQAGFHIENGRKLINILIKQCVLCQKLRGRTLTQQMAPLPSDRLEATPPFYNIGIDVFGPFMVHDGQNTRRTSASKKVWVLIFVCLCSRAVHLELLPGMDTSTFRNAFSRFLALRGSCKVIYSDHGTNFVSARKQLEDIDFSSIKKEL